LDVLHLEELLSLLAPEFESLSASSARAHKSDFGFCLYHLNVVPLLLYFSVFAQQKTLRQLAKGCFGVINGALQVVADRIRFSMGFGGHS
jgi:hypothetical protein